MITYSESEQFFLYRWKELFNERSFESFQVHFSTPLSILDEIDAALDASSSSPSSCHNVTDLLKEASELFEDDPIISTKFPFLISLIAKISTDQISATSASTFVHIAQTVRLLRHKLADYPQELFNEVNRLLQPNDCREKRRFEKTICCLGALLTQRGHSLAFLLNLYNKNPLQPLASRFSAITNINPRATLKYQCYCIARWRIRDYGFDGTQIKIVDKTDPILTRPECQQLVNQNRTCDILSLEVEAYDKVAACYKAIQELDKIAGLYHLYAPLVNKTAIIFKGVAVHEPQSDTLAFIQKTSSWHNNIITSKNPSNQVRRRLALKAQGFKDWKLLENSLQYHSLAMQAETDEAKLLNLWIALESLLPRHGETIISALSKIVPSVLASTYANQLCVRLSMTLKKIAYCNRLETRILPEWMSRSWDKTKGQNTIAFDTHDILQGLADIENGEKIRSMFAYVSGFPLLTHRFNMLWENEFRSRVKYYARLTRHQRHLDWQIRRIYRARNYVMHNGNSCSGLRYLVANLQIYFTGLIYTLLHDIELHKLDSLENAITYRLHAYNHLLAVLQQPKSLISTANMLTLSFEPSASADYPLIWTTP